MQCIDKGEGEVYNKNNEETGDGRPLQVKLRLSNRLLGDWAVTSFLYRYDGYSL